MSRRKILITGAGGFIGFELGNHLAARGHAVVGVDLQYPWNREAALFDPQTADFRDGSKMKALLKGVERIFHLASAHLSINLDEAVYWDVNVHSLPALLETARARGVEKFIHVSSVGVYGNLKTWPADEETACSPQSIYGETKLAGERAVQTFTEKTGFPTVILRPTWVYGSTCPRTRKLYRALRNRTFVMMGTGQNLRHPVYIADLLEAFERVMEQDQAPGEICILGGERALTTREIIRTLCSVFRLKKPVLHIPLGMGRLIASGVETSFRWIDREPPISRRTLEFFDTNNAFDISKARRLLKFSPQFSFEEGLYDGREALEACAYKTGMRR